MICPDKDLYITYYKRYLHFFLEGEFIVCMDGRVRPTPLNK